VWALGYFVCMSGNVTDEVISRYIAEQEVATAGEDQFQVSE